MEILLSLALLQLPAGMPLLLTSKYCSYVIHHCDAKFSRPVALVSPYLDWNTPKGLKVGTRPLNPTSLCLHRMHVTGVVCKVVYTKQIIGLFLCFSEDSLSLQENFFAKNGRVTKGKLMLQQVP